MDKKGKTLSDLEVLETFATLDDLMNCFLATFKGAI